MTWASIDKTSCVRQQIPARLDEIDRLCEEVRSWLDAIDLGQMLFEVTLLTREALVNAVRHGSQGDGRKWIDVDLSLEGEDLVIDVQDQGPGFDWKEKMHQDVSSQEEHGRGLMIIKSYANDIQYNQQGNRVTLRKTLAGWERDMSKVTKQQDSVIVRPDTDVVASMASVFRAELKGLIDEGAQEVTIDLAGVQMVDSVGLGVFIAAHNTLNQNNGRLTVSNASDDIIALLKTMRLDQHFTVLATEKEMCHE